MSCFTKKRISYTDKVKSTLLGVAVGDALGVPVEFYSRQALRRNPVTDMTGYGTHGLPAGTWSDDSFVNILSCRGQIAKKDEFENLAERLANHLSIL